VTATDIFVWASKSSSSGHARSATRPPFWKSHFAQQKIAGRTYPAHVVDLGCDDEVWSSAMKVARECNPMATTAALFKLSRVHQGQFKAE
jgi:hypothetical protein